MERIILVGTDPSIAELHRLMAREGVEVEVRGQLPEGITGNSPSVIMVDEVIEKLDAVILGGTSSRRPPPGLFALEACAEMQQLDVSQPARHGMPKYGNPRPYLKRKKGRS